MTKENLEKQRFRLWTDLGKIVLASEELSSELSELAQRSRNTKRSLEPSSGMYVALEKHNSGSKIKSLLTATYIDENGDEYQIEIKKTEKDTKYLFKY